MAPWGAAGNLTVMVEAMGGWITARRNDDRGSQVVGHLLDNAMKYSPVQMEFIDEGIGIPEAVDVFEPFRRGDRGVEETWRRLRTM